jgi:Raf kinase inhibitor-like YbhB/YbcL family protein
MRLTPLVVMALSGTALAGAPFSLTSAQLKAGATLTAKQVFNGFGCSGENQSPQLAWTNPPAGTKSFAVTVYDPDAPTGSGWWHWVVYNLPAAVRELPEGAGSGAGLPEGAVQGRTDFGAPGFGGACPPAGDKPHRYIFTVHALKVEKLEVPADATAAMVGFSLHATELGKATLTAKYGRAK